MSNTEAGREPVVIVEIDQAVCVNRFGVAPCTAALSTAVPNKCWNTRKTCEDVPNFDLAAVPLTVRFCKPMAYVPRDWNAIPAVVSVSTNPTTLNPGGASRNSGPLGTRATVTIKLKDFPSSDLKVDYYQAERLSGAAQVSGVGYNPNDRGTFWTKWLRRNPYYTNWAIRIREGYIEDDPASMITRHYIIEDITDPGPDGTVTIKAQDIMALADNDKAQCPVQSQGELDRDLTTAGYTLNCRSGADEWTRHGATNEWYWNDSSFRIYFEPDAVYINGSVATQAAPGALANNEWGWGDIDGIGHNTIYVRVDGVDPDTKPADYIIAHFTTIIHLLEWETGEYPAGGGTVRIGDECLTYTTATEDSPIVGTCTLSGVVRGTDGTTAQDHSDGDNAQLCYRVADADNTLCWEVVYDLLVNYAGIDAGFIPLADWNTEGNTYLPTMTATALITEATGVNQLISELCEQYGFFIWWDERDQEIKMKALRSPTDTPVELNERQHIIAGSWSFKADMNARVSQIWVYYSPKDPTKQLDDSANYTAATIRVDPSLEQPEKYGEARIKTIYSRWLESATQVLQFTTRYMNRFQDGAKYLRIRVDAKDRNIWAGSVVDVTMQSMVDTVGNPETRRWQVISAEEVVPGEIVEYNMLNYTFAAARYAFWMDTINLRSAAGQWTASGSGTNEYYFDNSGGLIIGEPAAVYINEPNLMVGATEGTIGVLAAGEWGWGNNDALGFNTVYVRLADGSDPDGKADGYVTADYPADGGLPDHDNPPDPGGWWSNTNGLMNDLHNGWSWQ